VATAKTVLWSAASFSKFSVLQDAITPANAAGVTIVVDVTGYFR
jgi:hypothetical protein